MVSPSHSTSTSTTHDSPTSTSASAIVLGNNGSPAPIPSPSSSSSSSLSSSHSQSHSLPSQFQVRRTSGSPSRSGSRGSNDSGGSAAASPSYELHSSTTTQGDYGGVPRRDSGLGFMGLADMGLPPGMNLSNGGMNMGNMAGINGMVYGGPGHANSNAAMMMMMRRRPTLIIILLPLALAVYPDFFDLIISPSTKFLFLMLHTRIIFFIPPTLPARLLACFIPSPTRRPLCTLFFFLFLKTTNPTLALIISRCPYLPTYLWLFFFLFFLYTSSLSHTTKPCIKIIKFGYNCRSKNTEKSCCCFMYFIRTTQPWAWNLALCTYVRLPTRSSHHFSKKPFFP